MNTESSNNAKTSKLFEKYKAAKKDFEYSSRKSKQNYFNNLKKTLSNPEISSKKKFTILKRLTNTGKNSNIPPLIDNDQIIHKPEQKAEIFNTHFAKRANLAMPKMHHLNLNQSIHTMILMTLPQAILKLDHSLRI